MEWFGDRRKANTRRRRGIVRRSTRMSAKGTSRGAAFGGGPAGATEGLENVARVRVLRV